MIADSQYRRISFVDDVEGIITGYIAIWGNPEQVDSYGTWFDKSRPPELDLDLLPVALRYEHGMDGQIQKPRIGEIYKVWFDDIGIPFEAKLDKSLPYYERVVIEIKEGTPNGPLRTSSGSQEYLTEFRNDGSFSMWPLGEVTLTAFASESRMPQVTIRSELQPGVVGAQTTLQTDESQEAETNDNGAVYTPTNEEEAIMFEQLQAVIAGLPEGAGLPELMAALIEVEGIDLADLEAAVGMLAVPPEEGEGERNDMPEDQQLINALAQIVEQRNAENQEQALADAQEEVRSLRMQNALHSTARSAPPPQQPPTGDTTGGNQHQHISVAEARKYARLSAMDMALGAKVLLGAMPAPTRKRANLDDFLSDEYIRHMANKVEAEMKDDKIKDISDRIAVRSALPWRATDAIDAVAITGQGAEWPGVFFDTAIWEDAYDLTELFGLMEGRGMQIKDIPQGHSSVKIKTLESDPTMYLRDEATDTNTDETVERTARMSAYGTGEKTLNAKEHYIAIFNTDTLMEDSIIDVLSESRESMTRVLAEGLEDAVINGDTTTSNNINKDGGSTTAAPAQELYLAWDGLRHRFLVDETALGVDNATAALGIKDYNRVLDLMPGRIRVRRNDLLYVIDYNIESKTRELPELLTPSASGEQNTLFTGVIPNLNNIQVYISGLLRAADTDGKVTDGGNVTDTGTIILVYPRFWAYGRKRDIAIETQRDILAGGEYMVATARHGFIQRGSNSTTGMYNIDIS